MRARLGRLLCRMGFHKWGEPYATTSDYWGFGCGHPQQDCERPDCIWTRIHRPS